MRLREVRPLEPDAIRTLVTSPILIGVQPLVGPGTGVETYSNALVRALDMAGVPWQTIETGLPRNRWQRRFRASVPGGRRAKIGGSGPIARDIFGEAQVYFDIHRRPLELTLQAPPGIAHFTYPVPLRVRGWHNLYTLHDVIPLLHPSLTPINAVRYRRMVESLKASAAGFITVSQASQQEICCALDVPRSFVTDLGQAVSVEANERTSLPAGLDPRGYFLYCGTIEPRKNIAALLAAHAQSGVSLPLVLAGPKGWQSDTISAAALREPAVIQLGYTSRETIVKLLSCARALLMPSLAEGFGLPVAEAMALGTPVITSDTGALAEVSGAAALHVEVGSIPQIAAAIKRLADDAELCDRLARQGRERATMWDLRSFGERLLAFYDGVDG